MKKIFICLLVSALSAALLTGCNGRQIFKQSTDPYQIAHYTSNEIENDIYYTKSGTEFTPVYLPEGKTLQGKTNAPDRKRVVWMWRNENMIPVIYKGDILAYKSESTDLASVQLERFQDVGYSIGIHDAYFEDGKIKFSYNKSAGEKTPAFTNIDGETSDNIEILAINNKDVTESMLDKSGVLTCFDKNETYQLNYNTGTTYKTCKVTANCHYLESWEMYSLTDIEMTKKGYIQINLPSDLKSGWYLVEGQGFFKYVASERSAAGNLKDEDFNTAYYTSEESQRAAYSQSYSVTFSKKTLNPTIEVIYDEASLVQDEEIDAVLISPDGNVYNIIPSERPAMDTDENNGSEKLERPAYLTCSLKEAIAGKWNIYVAPKSLVVANVRVLSNALDQETREDSKDIEVPEDKKNVSIYVDYKLVENEKKPYVNAIVVYPDGTSYTLKESSIAKDELVYDASYLPAGTYTVKFYHYSSIEMTECGIRENTEVQGEEIVNITG